MPETKRKPRFNIVDAIILLAVIALAAGFAYRALYKPVVSAVTPKVDITLKVRIKNVTNEVADAFIKELPSVCVSLEDTVPGSVVKSAYTEPYMVNTTNSDGQLLSVADPSKVDLVVTVESTTEQDDAVYKVGNQEVRIGRSFYVKTLSVELPGTIIEMLVTESKG